MLTEKVVPSFGMPCNHLLLIYDWISATIFRKYLRECELKKKKCKWLSQQIQLLQFRTIYSYIRRFRFSKNLQFRACVNPACSLLRVSLILPNPGQARTVQKLDSVRTLGKREKDCFGNTGQGVLKNGNEQWKWIRVKGWALNKCTHQVNQR